MCNHGEHARPKAGQMTSAGTQRQWWWAWLRPSAPVYPARDNCKTMLLRAGSPRAGLTDPPLCPSPKPWLWQMTLSLSNQGSRPGLYVRGWETIPGRRPPPLATLGSTIAPLATSCAQEVQQSINRGDRKCIQWRVAFPDKTCVSRGYRAQHPGRWYGGRVAAFPPAADCCLGCLREAGLFSEPAWASSPITKATSLLLNQKTKQMPTSAFLMQLIMMLHKAGVQSN